MERLTGKELRGLSEFLQQLYKLRNYDEFTTHLIEALPTITEGDFTSYNDVNPLHATSVFKTDVIPFIENPVHYGEVLEFAFPKDKLVYGPAQIEARIDQDTTISQQLSLWNQLGSRVHRGNLLVIPIGDTLLYVEPLYLSAETRELPELKRLIASSGDRVVMRQNVDALLTALVTKEAGQAPVIPATGPAVAGPPAAGSPSGETAAMALQHYRQALDALRKGDWQTFGIEMDALQKTLEGAAAAPPS